jgi:hypothetical protein
MRYIQDMIRNQTTLFPETLDEYINEDNPVRFIDAYVDLVACNPRIFKSIKGNAFQIQRVLISSKLFPILPIPFG